MKGTLDAVIIDSGGANLASLQFAFGRLNARAHVSSNPREIAAARRVILPGVGSASDAMVRLKDAGITALLPTLEQPILGICLGMQLLFAHSAEGNTPCLGILPDRVTALEPKPGHPVPHMGWNQLDISREDPLLDGINTSEYVYFVHSYAVAVGRRTLATADYGMKLSAVVRERNFWGTQFHPERSGTTGARLLANFLRLQ